jgi:hypothetical protein
MNICRTFSKPRPIKPFHLNRILISCPNPFNGGMEVHILDVFRKIIHIILSLLGWKTPVRVYGEREGKHFFPLCNG